VATCVGTCCVPQLPAALAGSSPEQLHILSLAGSLSYLCRPTTSTSSACAHPLNALCLQAWAELEWSAGRWMVAVKLLESALAANRNHLPSWMVS
jgi:hypothetical protein